MTTPVYLLRGLFEDPRNPNNMLSHLTRHLDPQPVSSTNIARHQVPITVLREGTGA